MSDYTDLEYSTDHGDCNICRDNSTTFNIKVLSIMWNMNRIFIYSDKCIHNGELVVHTYTDTVQKIIPPSIANLVYLTDLSIMGWNSQLIDTNYRNRILSMSVLNRLTNIERLTLHHIHIECRDGEQLVLPNLLQVSLVEYGIDCTSYDLLCSLNQYSKSLEYLNIMSPYSDTYRDHEYKTLTSTILDRELPIRNLYSLRILSLSNCNLNARLPKDINKLRNIRSLNIYYCIITDIPASITALNLEDSRIKEHSIYLSVDSIVDMPGLKINLLQNDR